MGDYARASILVGGILPIELVPEFMEHLGIKGNSIKEFLVPIDSTQPALGSCFEFEEDDVRNAEFTDFEDACHKIGLPFSRMSDACGEASAETTYFDCTRVGKAAGGIFI